MSEELTLENIGERMHSILMECMGLQDDGIWGVPRHVQKYADQFLKAARAHLSRPVVGEEQMREALETLDRLLNYGEFSLMRNAGNDSWRNGFKNDADTIRRAFLAMSDKLAEKDAEIAEYKAKADAYDAGQDIVLERKENTGAFFTITHPETVRVCNLVEGD